MGPQSSPVIVITGAAGGLGAAFCRVAAAHGASLVLCGRREAPLQALAAELNTASLAVAADVTRRPDVERLCAEAIARFGHIDVWINNAGQGITKMPSELTDEDIDTMMSVNVKSVLYGMQAVLPHFKGRGTGQIVNISSMLGRMPMATFRSAYCGAKHFVNALTATMRAEVQTTHPGIQVTLVSPGGVKTDFGVNARHGGVDSKTFAHFEEPEGVAAAMWEAVETRVPDLYTRPGAKDSVLGYLASLTADPTARTS